MDRTPTPYIASLVLAAAAGALAMFMLDPQSGTRRVALARDRTRRLVREAGDAAGVGWRDLRHRASGVAAGARHLVQREPVSDRVLEERVRAELGRWVSHPHAITVTVRDGRVLLGGAVLTAEHAPLTRAIESVRGVRQVDSQVMPYDQAGSMPMLQGGIVRSGRRPPWPRGKRHAPATQLVGASAGAALLAGGLLRGGLPGVVLAAVGAALAADVARGRRRGHQAEAAAHMPGRATSPSRLPHEGPRSAAERSLSQASA